jgi:hypothetical protein
VDNFGGLSRFFPTVVSIRTEEPAMSYVAIDPPAVAVLARELDAAAGELDARRVAVDRTLRCVGRAATAPARLAAVSSSARDSAADLRRRLAELAKLQVLYRHVGEPGPVYPRPDTTFPTFAAAIEAGGALGDRFAALADGTGWYDSGRVAPLLAELARHSGDPQFCAAFFAAMDPVIGTAWVSQLSELARRSDFPYDRDGAVAPYLTALGTALTAQPMLLDSYLKPIQGMLLPAEIRDVLRYGHYDDDTVLLLVRGAVERHLDGVHGMSWWEDEPGLLDPLSRSPELAQRFVAGLDDGTLRELLATGEGLVSGFGPVVYAAGYGSDDASYAAVERIVVTVGRHGTRLADDVQNGVAAAMGEHLELLARIVADGAYPTGFAKDQLVTAFVRVMDGNREAYVALHTAAADLTAQLLAVPANLAESSPALAALGAVHGLVASADAEADVDAGTRTAGYWAMASSALSLVPLPGPALAGAVAKKTVGSLLDAQGDAARARGEAKATIDVDTGYNQGRHLISVALWQRDAADHGGTSTLAPPAALWHADGSLKTLAEIDSSDERTALREWLARPVPWTVPLYDGTPHPATLDEATRDIDLGFKTAFQQVLMGR